MQAASCSRIGSCLSTKKLPMPTIVYPFMQLYGLPRHAQHTIFQVTWTQKYRPLTPLVSYILQVRLRRWVGRRPLHEEHTTLDVVRGQRYSLGAAQTLAVDVPALSMRYSLWDALHSISTSHTPSRRQIESYRSKRKTADSSHFTTAVTKRV